MKIGIDISTLLDEYYSGISGYTFQLLKSLFEADKKNRYFLYFNAFKSVKKLPFADNSNVRIISTNFPSKFFNYGMQKIIKYPDIEKIIGGVDVFFLPHMNFLATGGKAKKILTVHDLSFLHYHEFFTYRKNFWHLALNIRKIAAQQDAIIAVSENTKNDLIELCGIDKNKIKVIYSGINHDLVKADEPINRTECETEIIKKYRLPKKFIFYLGNLEPRKNIAGLIAAYDYMLRNDQSLADYKLVIAGANGWKSFDIFRNAKKSDFQKNILFTGYIEENEKKYFYDLASVFVYPSFYEGFGFPPLEAMVRECPCITSNNSSLSEIIGCSAILIDVDNYRELAESILTVLLKNQNHKQKSIILSNIKQKFSWKNTAEEYLNLFDSLKNY